MYRLSLHGLYGLYRPRCPLPSKRPINLMYIHVLRWIYALLICEILNHSFLISIEMVWGWGDGVVVRMVGLGDGVWGMGVGGWGWGVVGGWGWGVVGGWGWGVVGGMGAGCGGGDGVGWGWCGGVGRGRNRHLKMCFKGSQGRQQRSVYRRFWFCFQTSFWLVFLHTMVMNKTKDVWFLRTGVLTAEVSHKMVWYKMDNEISMCSIKCFWLIFVT